MCCLQMHRVGGSLVAVCSFYHAHASKLGNFITCWMHCNVKLACMHSCTIKFLEGINVKCKPLWPKQLVQPYCYRCISKSDTHAKFTAWKHQRCTKWFPEIASVVVMSGVCKDKHSWSEGFHEGCCTFREQTFSSHAILCDNLLCVTRGDSAAFMWINVSILMIPN